MAKKANLFTLRRRADGKFSVKAGIRIDFHEVKDQGGNSLGTVNGLVMGARYGRMANRAILIPIDFTKKPETGNDGQFVFRGSFLVEADGKKPRLQEFDPTIDEEGTCYLRVQTGFDPNMRGGASVEMGHMMNALGLKPGEPFKACRHGSVALEAGPISHQILGLGMDATTEEAEEIWRVIGRVGAFGVPPFTDILWKMPPKQSAVIGGNIDGTLALPVNDNGTIREAGTDGLRPVFEGLLPSRRAA